MCTLQCCVFAMIGSMLISSNAQGNDGIPLAQNQKTHPIPPPEPYYPIEWIHLQTAAHNSADEFQRHIESGRIRDDLPDSPSDLRSFALVFLSHLNRYKWDAFPSASRGTDRVFVLLGLNLLGDILPIHALPEPQASLPRPTVPLTVVSVGIRANDDARPRQRGILVQTPPRDLTGDTHLFDLQYANDETPCSTTLCRALHHMLAKHGNMRAATAGLIAQLNRQYSDTHTIWADLQTDITDLVAAATRERLAR